MAASTTLAQQVPTSSSRPQTSTTTSAPLSKTPRSTTSLAPAVEPTAPVPPYKGWWDPQAAVALGGTRMRVLTFRGSPTFLVWRWTCSTNARSPLALSRTGGFMFTINNGRSNYKLVRHRMDGSTNCMGIRKRNLVGDRRIRPRYPCLKRIDRYSYLGAIRYGDIVKGSLTVDPDGFLSFTAALEMGD